MSGCRSHAAARPGTAYVAVVVVAAIVSAISLAAVWAGRVRLRTAEQVAHAAEARLLAFAGAETAVQTISTDPGWRANVPPNTYMTERQLGNGRFTWKIVPEPEFAGQINPPVRVYGRGVRTMADPREETTRIISFLLRAPVANPANLLSNPGFERGVSKWSAMNGCELVIETSPVYAGSRCLWVHGRSGASAGPAQSLLGRIDRGAYEMEAWIRPTSSNTRAKFTVYVKGSLSTGQFITDSTGQAVTTDRFRRVTMNANIDWSGSLEEAWVRVDTAPGQPVASFYVDEVVFRERPSTSIEIIPGSWRQELQP